ncbi:hypothetical protein MPH_03561 [Macrophomina phaseolina MS6]|uniref:Uncharacterized protein n=1 Tax=Macrophomina phaseolina (strain MS6) TaxID=1126212 RepID=K2R9M0_MACPH|nr:hypothetical protein MPH_03561 [Macrophomina phaseolina MS6]
MLSSQGLQLRRAMFASFCLRRPIPFHSGSVSQDERLCHRMRIWQGLCPDKFDNRERQRWEAAGTTVRIPTNRRSFSPPETDRNILRHLVIRSWPYPTPQSSSNPEAILAYRPRSAALSESRPHWLGPRFRASSTI